MTDEEILREWYESMKAEDEHHFAAHEEYGRGGDFPAEICEYTFEMFKGSPMARHGLKVFRKYLPEPKPPKFYWPEDRNCFEALCLRVDHAHSIEDGCWEPRPRDVRHQEFVDNMPDWFRNKP